MEEKLKHPVFEFQTERHNFYLSNENFGQRLHKNSYDPNLASIIPFPNDHTLSLFSELAYEEEIYPVSYLKNWEVLTRAKNSNLTNRYKGVVFWNPKLCHIVVAHQGTTPKSTKLIGDFISDIQLALHCAEIYQAPSAASLVHRVVEEIKKQNGLDGPHFRLSITGHSLGAWLAQYTTFTAKFLKVENGHFVRDENYLNNVHPHTVVFDCPGCYENLEALIKKITYKYSQDKFGEYKSLDMTVYLNKPNYINRINKQVGVLYLLPVAVHNIADVTALFESCRGNVVKDVVLYGKSGFRASATEFIKSRLPFYTNNPQDLITKRARHNVCSLNTFTEYELEFIRDLWQVLVYNRENEEKFLKKFFLPQFKLNYQKNTLESEQLGQFVAKVKNLRPTKVKLFDALKSYISDSEMLKMESRLFKNKLTTFNGYHFKDIYNLQDFLRGHDPILHIRVDVDSSVDYQFETSILNNLFQFYRKDHPFYLSEKKHRFLKWDDVCNLNFTPHDCFNTQSFNLVVLECFEIENEAKLCAFLKNISTKAVVLSTNTFSWKGTLKTNEIDGFSSDLSLKSLNEDSQKVFWNQKIYKINENALSFHDLFQFSNKLLRVDAFLELLLRPRDSIIELRCPYSNLLKGVFFESLYREVKDLENLRNIPRDSIYVIKEDSNEIDLKVGEVFVLNSAEEFDELCLQELSKTNYLFVVKESKIILTRIFNPHYYINRTITHNKILSKEFFLENDITDDFYVFCGKKEKFKEIVDCSELEYNCLRFVNTEVAGLNLIKSLGDNSNAHLFKLDEDTITWLYSVGSLHILYKHMEENEIVLNEIDIFKNEKVVIISGEPGVGKSSIIEYLYLKLQTSYWVFAVQLKDCDFNFLSHDITHKQAAEFIINSCSFSNGNCIEPLLSYCLGNETKLKVCLMFDSFEGVLEKESRHKMIKLLQFLKESHAKILITTRPHLCKQLENGLSVFASHFKNLNLETEMKSYFVTFWKSQLRLFNNSVDDGQLEGTASEILRSAENVIGNAIGSFIGIPMHLRLIAETITPPLSTSLYHISDVLHLYQKYVKNQCNVYFKKFVLSPIHRDWLETCILDKMIQVALYKFKNLNVDHFAYNEMEELYHVGLIYFDNNKLTCSFSHDSVCDFFTSNCLQQWLTSPIYFIHADWNVEEFLVCTMFINYKYKIIRFFLNCYFKNLVVATNRSSLCKNKLEEVLARNKIEYVNENNESVVHVCVKENLLDLLQHFLFKTFSSASVVKLLALRNSLLETPLYNALVMHKSVENGTRNALAIIVDFIETLSSDEIKEVLLATMFTHFMLKENVDYLVEYGKKYRKVGEILSSIRPQIETIPLYLNACQLDDLVAVTKFLNRLKNDQLTLKYLLMTTNESQETGLHLTSDLKLAKMLVRPYNLNLQDAHGMTALARAAKEMRPEIGEMLISKGATLIPDLFLNTPQMHCAKSGNLKLYKVLTAKIEIKVDEINSIGVTALMLASKFGQLPMVNSLIARNANVSIKERNGYTALFYAVLKNHPQIVKVLFENGSDINVQNRYGFTPLHVSIKNKKLSMIYSLLDRGADVNVGNLFLKEYRYPLQVLIKLELDCVIEKVLKVRRDRHGNELKVDFTVLSQEEKAYLDRRFPNFAQFSV